MDAYRSNRERFDLMVIHTVGNENMNSKNLLSILAVLFVSGCASTRQRSDTLMNDYGPFPEISLLPESEAKAVSLREGFTLPQDIAEDDFNEVLHQISRIPDDTMLGNFQREVVSIWAGVPFQNVAIQVQLKYNIMLVFVKSSPTNWKIAGIYLFET